MGIGTHIVSLLGTRTSSDVVAEWVARHNDRERGLVSTEIAELAFAELQEDKPTGVRYFFGRPTRATDLFGVLGVAPETSEELSRLAADSLANDTTPACATVMDISHWAEDWDAIDALALMLEQRVLPQKTLTPAVLVLTFRQYRRIPRTLDDWTHCLTLDRQHDEDTCGIRAREIAGDSAVLISHAQYSPFERWIGIDCSRSKVVMSPSDGPESVVKSGRLPALPIAQLRLLELAMSAAESPPPLPKGGAELRELMVALCSGVGLDRWSEDPAVRLAWASMLNVDASASERETIEHQLSTLVSTHQLDLIQSADAILQRDRLIERASRRAVHEQAFRIGDEIHIVGPLDSIALAVRDHPRVVLHPIARREPALCRLRDAIATMSRDDLLDDPFLEHLIDKLDPKGNEKISFSFARAALLRRGVSPGRVAAPCSDWRAALSSLIGGDPPPAGLLARSYGSLILPLRLVQRSSAEDLGTLAYVPAAMGFPIRRGQQLRGWRLADEPGALFPVEVEAWQDALEAWIAGKSPPLSRRVSHGHNPYEPTLTFLSDLNEQPSPTAIPGGNWSLADAILSSVWLGLRRALASSDSIRRHNGVVQAHMGSGVCALLDICEYERHDNSVEIQAFVSSHVSVTKHVDAQKVESYSFDAGGFTSHTSFPSDSDSKYPAGWECPREVYISGKDVSARVTFTFVPWLTDAPIEERLRTPIRSRLEDEEAARLAEEARRRAD